MKRTAVNPWPWSLSLGYNQAEIIEAASRQLVCAGQTAVDANGNPQRSGDMRGQLALSLDNLETVGLAKWISTAAAPFVGRFVVQSCRRQGDHHGTLHGTRWRVTGLQG